MPLRTESGAFLGSRTIRKNILTKCKPCVILHILIEVRLIKSTFRVKALTQGRCGKERYRRRSRLQRRSVWQSGIIFTVLSQFLRSAICTWKCFLPCVSVAVLYGCFLCSEKDTETVTAAPAQSLRAADFFVQ